MVEYVRLISKDSILHMVNNWDRQDTVVLVAVLAVIFVIGYLVVRKR
jgi:hypothetical protein